MALATIPNVGVAGGGSVNFSAGTVSGNLASVVFSNLNGVTFGLNGSTVTASVGAGGVAGSISAGATSVALGQAVFSDSNNVSFGLAGSTVTATATFAQTVQTQNFVAASAGTQAATSGTVLFADSNGITFGMSGSSRITASHNGLTSQSNQAFSAGGGSSAFQTLTFGNSFGVSFSNSGGSVMGSVAAQTNQTLGLFASSNTTLTSSGTADARSLSFRGIGGVTVGISNNEVLISGATGGGGGGGGATLSYFANLEALNNTNSAQAVGSSLHLQPFRMPQAISVGYMRFPVSMSRVSTSRATSAAGWSFSAGQSNTLRVGIFTQGTGASSLSFGTIGSTTATWNLQFSITGSASSHSISYNYSFPISSGSSSTQLTTQGTSATATVAPAGTSNWQSYRYLDVAWPTSLSAGDYWLGVQRHSTSAGAAIGMNISLLAVTQHNSSIASINAASNSSIGLMLGLGSVSTNNTTLMPVAFALSNVSTVASYLIPYFQMIRQA